MTVQNLQATQAHEQSTVTTTSFEGVEYCLGPATAQKISFQPSRPWNGFFGGLKGDLCACTVIDYYKDHFDKEDIAIITSEFTRRDDVWTPAFLEGEASCYHEIATESCLQYDTSQQSSYSKGPKVRNYALRKMGFTFF